ncbi:MAG: hypothetical protein ACREVK_04175 [Gammaproteobacteria bacterium]
MLRSGYSRGKRELKSRRLDLPFIDDGIALACRAGGAVRVHPTQISHKEVVQASLNEEIGRLKMELEWVKKLRASAEQKRRWIDPGHPELSIRRQRALLGLSRSSVYYKPARESPYDPALMRCIDAQCTRTPFYGSGV